MGKKHKNNTGKCLENTNGLKQIYEEKPISLYEDDIQDRSKEQRNKLFKKIFGTSPEKEK